MRYVNAPHVDHGPLMTRRPRLGHLFSILGYTSIVVVLLFRGGGAMHAWLLLAVLATLWLWAWSLAVGERWRAPLVAAALIASIELARLEHGLLAGGAS